MEVAIVTTILGAVVTTALQEAVKAINNKKNKAKVEASADSIGDKITRVSGKVRLYQRSHKDTSDDWRYEIAQWRRLLCDIEDCIDKFNINIKQQGSAEQFATKMNEFKTESEKQSGVIEAYIREHEGSPSAPLQGQPDSPNNHAGRNLVGIEERRKDLLALVLGNFKKQLQAKAGNPKVTKVISIVGSRGVGKTCLASQVYLHPKLPNSFPLRAFVSATGKHKGTVLEEVLQQLHSHGPGGSVQDPRAYLRSTNMWCFIVVDDVHDLELGSVVINEFRELTKVDGIIILTTTVQSFAQSWSLNDGHVYKMRPLSARLSRTLFMGHCRCPVVPEPEDFGEGCDDGVPLAVITWARYWREERHGCKTVWSKFGDRESGFRVEPMERVLKHSYDSLADDNLQTCLLYFSLFRPENSVRRGSLVRRWQAEGAEVGCGDGCNKSMEKWKMLVDRNILCPIQVSINEGAKTCRPSGAMHGYIISHESRTEAGFARVCSGGVWPSGQVIRRLSLQTHGAEDLTEPNKVSRLRTLVVSPENNEAADLSLDECRLLRVLDLEAYGGRVRLEEVCNKLKLLRYLSLRSELISDVPQAIKELKELETLDVGKEKVVRVHVDVLLLPKLKHLVGKIQLQTTLQFRINPGRFRGQNLVTLAGFKTLGGKGFPSVMQNMENLRKVKVFFDPKASADSLSSRLAAAITAFLPKSANHPDENQRWMLSIDTQECKQPASALDSLENAKGRLYSLKLCGTFNLNSLPSFIHENKLMGIEKLCISFDTPSWQAIINGQDRLPDLKYLKLVAKGRFPGVSTNTSVLHIKMDQFKNLERMCLQSKILPKIQVEDEALTKLVSLHLISGNIGPPTSMMCNSSTANQIPQLKNLKEVALRSSSPVDDDIKKAWHGAARGHPKSPQVLFI